MERSKQAKEWRVAGAAVVGLVMVVLLAAVRHSGNPPGPWDAAAAAAAGGSAHGSTSFLHHLPDDRGKLLREVEALQAEVDSLRRRRDAAAQSRPTPLCPTSPRPAALGQHGSPTHHSLLSIPDDGVDPPLSTGIVAEFNNVCLRSMGGDRFQNPAPRGPAKPPGFTEMGRHSAFVVLDLCKMGHQPKDAVLLHALIQERGSQAGPLRVVYGNRCMDRDAKRSKGAWHHVLRHWFDVAGGKSQATYIGDHKEGLCLGKMLRRPHLEPFRWMRNGRQAEGFRRDFLAHFDVVIPERAQVHVTVVRRGIERHFDEDATYRAVRDNFPGCSVRYLQFDGDANPTGTGKDAERMTSYAEQLKVLASTDVLIAAHGAALSSVVALPRGAAVFEMFPHNFRYHMYAELAELFGLRYYPIESSEPMRYDKGYCSSCVHHKYTPLLQPYYANGLKNCKGSCTAPCKKCDIKYDMEKWHPQIDTAIHYAEHGITGSLYLHRKLRGAAATASPITSEPTDDTEE